MTSDRLIAAACGMAIAACAGVAAAAVYVLAQPLGDLEPQPQHEACERVVVQLGTQPRHLAVESRRRDVVHVAAVVPESACGGEGFVDEVVHAQNFGRAVTFNDIQFDGVPL